MMPKHSASIWAMEQPRASADGRAHGGLQARVLCDLSDYVWHVLEVVGMKGTLPEAWNFRFLNLDEQVWK